MTRPIRTETQGTSPATRPGVQLQTADGERLHAEVWPGPPGAATGSGAWVVLAHGFSGATSVAAVRAVADRLSRRFPVLAYDARGHGRSTGRTTLGDREVLDVDAAVRWARAAGAGAAAATGAGAGGGAVATVGFSMGAAAVVRHAAGVTGFGELDRPDAVVVVSGTGPWSTWRTASTSMRRLHLLVETRVGRLVSRVALRTRIDPRGWPVPPVAPADCVAAIAAPLLLVHGDRDGYLGLSHAHALAERSGAPLWVERGLGHAEVAVTPELLDRIADHLAAVLAGAHDATPDGAGPGT